MNDNKSRYEEFRVTGEQLLAKVKEIIHEGNIRRLIIKNGNVCKKLELNTYET